MANDIASDADLDTEPADNFDDLRTAMRALSGLFANDNSALALLTHANAAIAKETKNLEIRKKKKDEENEDNDDWDLANYAPGSSADKTPEVPTPTIPRSIFSDVDE